MHYQLMDENFKYENIKFWADFFLFFSVAKWPLSWIEKYLLQLAISVTSLFNIYSKK